MSASHGPGTLPRQLTLFVGRRREVADLAQVIAGAPLVTLVGPGGIGKTRLALAAAACLTDAFPDGVWWVDLSGLADAALVSQTIAAAVRVTDGLQRSPAAVLVEALQQKRLLLVLDNCEHLIEACATMVDRLLRRCPDVHVVATSREPLGLAGERRWPVPPLDVPAAPAALSASPDTLQMCGAVALFLDRARLVCPGFRLTPHNAAAVAQLCRQLDGVPLAIELAAAHVSLLSVEQIVARLADRFRLLVGGRAHLRRHQALEACVTWSYERLTPAERRLFTRLSVFAGSFSLAAAEAIAQEETAHPPATLLTQLGRLVHKSMVVADASRSGEARYRLLDTMREYGQERLAAGGDGEGILRRHALYYLQLAVAAGPHLVGARQLECIAQLDEEYENVRQALRWLVDHDQAEAVMRAAAAIWRFWMARGYHVEWGDWLAAIRALPAAVAYPALQGRLLHAEGVLAAGLGDDQRARACCEAALVIQRACGDAQGSAWSLQVLGYLTLWEDVAAARRYVEESLAIRRTLGDRWELSHSLSQVGGLAEREGDLDAAQRWYTESLAVRRAVGDQIGVARTLEKLVSLLLRRGDAQAAGHYLAAYAAIRARLGTAVPFSPALHDLTLGKDGPRLAGLRRLLEDELARQLQAGALLDAMAGCALLGALAVEQGDLPAAREFLARGLALGSPTYLGTGLLLLGWAALAARLEDALDAVRLAAAADALAGARGAALPWAWRKWRDRWLPAVAEPLGTAAAAAQAEGAALSPEHVLALVKRVKHQLAGRRTAASRVLTAREREVVNLVAQGLTNPQIAAALVITRATASRHVEHILAKLDLRSRAQIAVWATEQRQLAPQREMGHLANAGPGAVA